MAANLHQRLILADGTILEDSECGYNDGELHCWVKNLTLNDAFNLFLDENRIRVIKYQYRDTTWVYKDFTDLFLIRKMEKYIDVWLKGGTEGGIEQDEEDQTE